jgi:hypothetical protein
LVVTSIVKGRGRVIGVVAVLTTAVALVSVPAAFGAVDGDPIATSTFKFKLSGKFKKQLKKNGVKMKPKALKLTKGDVDPTTGAGDVRFGKVTFKKGGKKIAFNNLKGSMPGKVKANEGAIFKLTSPSVARNGFGADLTGTKVKLLKSAAKKISKGLDLSKKLKPATAGSFNLSYQPTTVKIISGTANVAASIAAGSAGLKFLAAHCVNGLAPNGITPIAPATSNGAVPPTFTFPVTSGTVSPAATSGVIQLSGGLRNNKNDTSGETPGPPPDDCTNGGQNFPGTLDITDLAVNLEQKNIQSHTVIVAAPPAVFGGDKGVAIGQKLVTTNLTVAANPANHTITLSGADIQLNGTSSLVLNGVFPNVSGNPANDFADGDPFGTASVTVTVR